MPRPRFMRLEAERRAEWLEAAAEEFAVRGYDQASLNAILERLGMSKGQFYYYFDDKADLFGAVFDWTLQRMVPTDLVSTISGLSRDAFWPYFERLAEEKHVVLRAMPWYMGLMRHFYHPPSEESARRVVDAARQLGEELRVALMRRGQELSLVRTDLPDELLFAMINALSTARDHWFLDHWDELTPEQRYVLPRRLMGLFRRAFEPPPAPSAAGRS